jgi:hypothetical protein
VAQTFFDGKPSRRGIDQMDPAARRALVSDVAVGDDWLTLVGCLHIVAGRRTTEDEGLHGGKIDRTPARANDLGQRPT